MMSSAEPTQASACVTLELPLSKCGVSSASHFNRNIVEWLLISGRSLTGANARLTDVTGPSIALKEGDCGLKALNRRRRNLIAETMRVPCWALEGDQ